MQAVAAAHVLFQFPSSKVALESMASFEYAWHVELDALMAALKCLAPSEKGGSACHVNAGLDLLYMNVSKIGYASRGLGRGRGGDALEQIKQYTNVFFQKN